MKEVTESVAKVAIALFNELAKDAKQEELEQHGTFTIWRGSMLGAFESVCNTRNYYTISYNLLSVSNCISILNRGARHTGSVIVLHGAPALDELLSIDSNLLTGDRGYARLALEAQMKDLIKSFRGLNVVQALENHESRLFQLERKERKENEN